MYLEDNEIGLAAGEAVLNSVCFSVGESFEQHEFAFDSFTQIKR